MIANICSAFLQYKNDRNALERSIHLGSINVRNKGPLRLLLDPWIHTMHITLTEAYFSPADSVSNIHIRIQSPDGQGCSSGRIWKWRSWLKVRHVLSSENIKCGQILISVWNLFFMFRQLEKRDRQAGFSSWAGKRGGRNNQQAFSSWAGKRSGRGQHQQTFSSWAGKRAPFNSWAGKRSSEEEVFHEPEYVRWVLV